MYIIEKKVKSELIKRYLYLFENKELILSLCINKAIEKDYYQEQLKKIMKTKKDAKKYCKDNESMLKMLDVTEKSYKELLKKTRYYLFEKINNNIVSMYEQFLFTDDNIENTFLYKYIEELKVSETELEEIYVKIEGLNQRRSAHLFLRHKNPFTVWKILDYVREKNYNNQVALKALDKYYNIDRYMQTGVNWESGYVLVKNDIDCIENNETYLYDNAIIKSRKNEFESEDEFFETEIEDFPMHNVAFSCYMENLSQIKMLSLEEKQKIYNKIFNTSEKTLVKK